MNSLDHLPRVPLVLGPTPLHSAPRLSEELGVEVWFKRDDLTGLGLGGNKVRMLEYLLGDAVEAGCDSVVTGAGAQSNWAMLAALAARRLGLDPYLVFYGQPGPAWGNQALAELIGADIRFTGDAERSSVDIAIAELAEKLGADGKRPYPLPRGGATATGACGYVRASAELADQLRANGLSPGALWLATGSCGTQAGLVAGALGFGASYQVVGVTVSRPAQDCRARVRLLAELAGDLLALPRGPAASDVIVVEGYLGPGYGRPSEAGQAAARLVARTEGIFLDPVFGAKAMAALADWARWGCVTGPVVFLVTGGAPSLFGPPGERW